MSRSNQSVSDNRRPNVLLIVLDSVRAENCSTYDYQRETTPFLTEFAEKEATLYEQARAPSIHSIASHASMFSGYHVEEHQVTEHTSYLDPSANIFHELSQEHGYSTGMFSPNVVITEASNLGDCFGTKVGPKRTKFQIFDGGLSPMDIEGEVDARRFLREALAHDKPVRSILNGLYSKLTPHGGSQDPSSESGEVYVDEFFDWLSNRGSPWAACLNLMDAHSPYAPEPRYNKWANQEHVKLYEDVQNASKIESFSDNFWEKLGSLEPLYDGCIRQADAVVTNLVDHLKDVGEYENTLLVITSDHGEAFGEKSRLSEARLRGHSWGIGEVQTHVPLLVKRPHQENSKTVKNIATLTQFAQVVENTISDDSSVVSFVPDEDQVISSTYRIKPPGDELPLSEPDREPYFGPWRAVYRDDETGVVKYATRRDNTGTFRIRDTGSLEEIEDTDAATVVEEVFQHLRDGVQTVGEADERELTEDVEDKLADLGYLR